MKYRIQTLDLIKIIALLAIIALYSARFFFGSEGDLVACVLYVTGVIGIPLFFMVNGYLMLNKENLNYRYVVRKVFGILKFVTIICLYYLAFFNVLCLTFSNNGLLLRHISGIPISIVSLVMLTIFSILTIVISYFIIKKSVVNKVFRI